MRIPCSRCLIAAGAVLALSSCASPPVPVRTVPLGEKVTTGHLAYAAYETQWLTHIGEGATQRVPQNRFFLVRVAITNTGADRLASPSLSVIDDSGGAYQELSDGAGVTNWIGLLRQLGKGDHASGYLVLDVTPTVY